MSTSGASERRRRAGYAAVWLVAAALSVTVGILAVNTAGASLRDRGPIGSDDLVGREDPSELTADPEDPVHADTIAGEYGEFDVECQGVVVRGSEPRPAAGWRTVTYERGPDDDVDAVFESQDQVLEIEVYCNGGRPAVAEEEAGIRPGRRDGGG